MNHLEKSNRYFLLIEELMSKINITRDKAIKETLLYLQEAIEGDWRINNKDIDDLSFQISLADDHTYKSIEYSVTTKSFAIYKFAAGSPEIDKDRLSLDDARVLWKSITKLANFA